MRKFTKEELNSILELHRKWLIGEDGGERAYLSSANLSYADLSSANLSYADLRSADLSSANLSYADLSYANLSYANLLSANLSSANLSSADLSYANLSYANLSSADLSYANLSYANLSYANLRSADLSSANLRSADLSSADLLSANLSTNFINNAVGNGKELKSIQIEQDMKITYKSDRITFGCNGYDFDEWLSMAGHSSEYWEKYRDLILKITSISPAIKWEYSQKEEQ